MIILPRAKNKSKVRSGANAKNAPAKRTKGPAKKVAGNISKRGRKAY